MDFNEVYLKSYSSRFFLKTLKYFYATYIIAISSTVRVKSKYYSDFGPIGQIKKVHIEGFCRHFITRQETETCMSL